MEGRRVRDVDTLFDCFTTKQITSEDMTIEEREAVHLRVLIEAISMPLFDFKCETCGRVKEFLLKNGDVLVPCPENDEHGPMVRQPSAPSFKVNGYNQMTGYSGEQTRVQHHGNGVRTEVKGNFEAFDRLT